MAAFAVVGLAFAALKLDWKSILESNINTNCFQKCIYDQINYNLKELKCFESNYFDECLVMNDKNVLICVEQK